MSNIYMLLFIYKVIFRLNNKNTHLNAIKLKPKPNSKMSNILAFSHSNSIPFFKKKHAFEIISVKTKSKLSEFQFQISNSLF